MTTRYQRRLTISLRMTCLLCLFLLTHPPVSSGQQPTAADVPALVKQLNDKDAKVRIAAARQLLSSGEEAKAAVATLIELVKDEDKDIRRLAFDALDTIGTAARPAVPALSKS
jgi:HEAT repeat protein